MVPIVLYIILRFWSPYSTYSTSSRPAQLYTYTCMLDHLGHLSHQFKVRKGTGGGGGVENMRP